uniref:Rix7 n=1 Tax=Thermochaetoides thermophila TaxID=209285 RepID=UPI001EFF5E4B|nr:Chain A, Rix7 [Thermochaetoides thermophila]7T3I_B Chain B, Rix7 [Thermochaetoides thermophila]7T3I_C Chain C, Rix7 [Thermochaetoides thermophila]7T3I_D Chain D, Rix7 [Thermochaetoides thermophila]7T3I_E Chain E, Rix7 [Thermochaetoides thermophila]7T3I_F Chain F, Rix7 [Thermochaetoides thermophila]
MSRRPTLRLGLDRDVYNIVLNLEQQGTDENGKRPRLTVDYVYDTIKRSNSSLARQKKRMLEDSIERVLAVRKEQAKAEEETDSDDLIEAQERERERQKAAQAQRDANLLNRQIAKSWGFASSPGAKAADGEKGTDTGSIATPAPATPAVAENMAADTPTTSTGPVLPASSTDRQPNGEPRPKKRKAAPKEIDRTPPTKVSILDIAGVDDTLQRLLKEVWFPLRGGEACEKMGYRYDNGVLLHGPSGCGKTTLAHAIAGSIGVAFIPVSAPSVIGGTSGESEKNIRDVFDEAIRLAPCLIFLDEIDAIAGRRESANKGMESRIVAEIMNGMDRIRQNTPLGKNVVVLAATNRPEFLDPAIRRRFSVEIDMGMPSERAREQILRSLTRDLSLADDINFKELAKMTPGYVGSDLQYVVKAAVSESFQANIDSLLAQARAKHPADHLANVSQPQRDWLLLEAHRDEEVSWPSTKITMEQFRKAVSLVQPASKREGFSTIPDTTWSHVGALEDVRKKLEMSIIGPIKNPELFTRVGIKPAAGILLWGPPGCGKTLVAKAVANESKANFISIKGPELLNKYVGESERAVRQLFSRAKSSAPCILFFDQMDALVPRRDDSLSDASARVVNTLLTELDGVGDRSGIYVIGATNRPDMIDEAIRRPGRLGTSIYVGLPSAEDRVKILKTLYRNTVKAPKKREGTNGEDVDMTDAAAEQQHQGTTDADLEKVALDLRCTGFSGADLGNLMQAAAQACLERVYTQRQQKRKEGGSVAEEEEIEPVITMEDWEKALNEVKPSVKDPEKYMHSGFAAALEHHHHHH